eukprot:4532219-Amphidinium_carterae.1
MPSRTWAMILGTLGAYVLHGLNPLPRRRTASNGGQRSKQRAATINSFSRPDYALIIAVPYFLRHPCSYKWAHGMSDHSTNCGKPMH